MKRLFFILLLIAYSVRVDAWEVIGSGASTDLSYEMMETFDPTGYLLSGWTETGTPDEDYTPALVGSQSIRMIAGEAITRTFTPRDIHSIFLIVRPEAITTTGDASMVTIRDSGGTGRCYFRMDADGTVQARYSTTNGPNTVTAMNTSTTYCTWVDFDKAGSCTVSFDPIATCTKPTSGNQFSTATGTATNQAVSEDIQAGGTGTIMIYDNVYHNPTPIGSNP